MHPDIRAYNAKQAPVDKAICNKLAKLIEAQLKTADSKVWHGHPVWFIAENPIVGYDKLKDCVRLLFWSGQSFKEPGLKSEGSFKAAEARYTAVAQINEADLLRWLDKAVEIQWDYKNIRARQGKLQRIER
ncbi:MAG: DUF1801 domain-containing protein [Patescibacteria group bacterium]